MAKMLHAMRMAAAMLLATGSLVGDPEPPQLPQLLEVLEPLQDFGRVRAGTRMLHEFRVTNQGNETVEITAVETSCACLAPGVWPAKLKPGESATLPVELHTEPYSGAVAEHLTVRTRVGPGDGAVLTLDVRAVVWRPLEATPASAVFEARPDAPESATCTIRIVNQLSEPVELKAPESSHRGIEATLRSVVPGREYELIVRAVPPMGRGNVFGRVSMATSSPEMPVLEIPVHALVPAPRKRTVEAAAPGKP
ncbi:MAG: DUF1573 domain-containing protein [Verrucomicrobiae bacterium]|nr:DUF1573 domain-containing protein [Verrucomicrobiae bacterium]